MTCYNCGSQIADGSTVCPVCATSNVNAPQPENTAQPVYQQPVYQPVYQQPMYQSPRKSSGISMVLAILLLIVAVICFGTGLMFGCVACVADSDESLIPTPTGEWYTYDDEEFLDVGTPVNDMYEVESERLSRVLFGNDDAEFVLFDVEQSGMFYSTAVLDAEYEGETVRFIVYFNDLLLTVEDEENSRITLCRESDDDDDDLRDLLEGTTWGDSGTYSSIFFTFEEGVGTMDHNGFETAFDWTVYGDYLIIYVPEDDNLIIYYTLYDPEIPSEISFQRFQNSSSADTESVIWNSLGLERM